MNLRDSGSSPVGGKLFGHRSVAGHFVDCLGHLRRLGFGGVVFFALFAVQFMVCGISLVLSLIIDVDIVVGFFVC